MNILMWLLVLLLVIFVVLGVTLAIMFVRLTKELRRLGDDTETMVTKAGRMIRAVQVIVPTVTLMRRFRQTMAKGYQRARSREVDNDKATDKK